MIDKARKNRYVPLILVSLALVLLGAGAVALVRNIISGVGPTPKKIAQEIHVIRPPPPPPDLPPPPPPPPEEKVNVPDPQHAEPDPTPSNEPPPGDHLALDAEGTAGGDEFGLAGHKGGRDLIGSGGGSALAWYAGVIKNEIMDQLNSDKETSSGQYSLDVRFWVRGDGTVDHLRIMQSSGNRDRDRAIETALARIKRFGQTPPEGWPGPITMRLVRRS